MKAKNDAESEWKKKIANCKKLLHETPIELERVIGSATHSNHSISINKQTGEIAYPVGSIIWIYKPKENRQTMFLFNANNRIYNCVQFSKDGVYLAAGEGTTRQPEVTIWKFDNELDHYEEYCTLGGHKLCIEAIFFSPNSKYLIGLGNKHDKGLIVWDVEKKVKLTTNKLTKLVRDVSFQEESKYFVTWGDDHLKFWYFDENGEPIRTQALNQSDIGGK